jgi:hypothetical protein
MPAGSEPAAGVPALPHTWRPLGPRVVAAVLGAGLVVVLATFWISLDAETQAAFTAFQLGTVLVLLALGFAVLFGLVRSRVTADRSGLVVVNGYRRHEYDWAQIVAVHLPPGAPWATLDLADGDSVSACGIQGSDGERSRRAVRQLRLLVAELSR